MKNKYSSYDQLPLLLRADDVAAVLMLTPVEAERLQGFDDEWTNSGMPDRMRYFCMGNALVVPMITRMGKVLDTIIAEEA